MTNIVYIATSLDGYIAAQDGGLDWLHSVPNPDNSDFGFAEFMSGIDALVMGRNTFETVCGFGGEWPYSKPVFVLSSTLKSVPQSLESKVFLIKGTLNEILATLDQKGFKQLYIDGGKTIQSFLAEDLIDELIITQIPVLLGGGISLFGALAKPLMFEHVDTKVVVNTIVQSHYHRQR